MKRVAALVTSSVLVCVLALPAFARTRTGPLGVTEESSAESYLRSRLGAGAQDQSLRCVTSWAEDLASDDPRVPQRCGTGTHGPILVNFCAFTFLPKGRDVAPVQVVVSQRGTNPWTGEVPDCNANPEHCEVAVGRSAVIDLAESIGLSPGLGNWNVQLQYRPEYGASLQWLVYDGLTRTGLPASNRLLVVDAYTGEWFETKTPPYTR